MSDENILDVRNQLCPMPVIKTQNQLKLLHSGAHLKVRCTDPGALQDIPAWCKVHGHSVIEVMQESNEIIFLIQKKGEDDSVMA